MSTLIKQKKLSLSILVFLLLGFVSFLTACGSGTSIAGIHMSNPETLVVPYGNFSYEGVNVTVDFENGSTTEIPLREEMISEVERLKFFKMGNQDIEVVYRSKYKTAMPIEVVLNEFKESYALNGYECVYDGLPHMVTPNQELPEGATITYPYGNMFTNAGTYQVVGIMEKNGYKSKTLSTTLIIRQAERDAHDIVFEDETHIYNGEIQSIEATNVPEGVEVSYDVYDFDHDIRINKVVNAGKYRIIAHFNDTSPNYKKIPDKEAILTIERAHYDMSNVQLKDVTKEYDGMPYEAKITGAEHLPSGVQVSYAYYNESGNRVTNNSGVGTYTMVASFTGGALDNYYPIESLSATLTVTHRIIKISDKIAFDSKMVNFEENTTHSLEISGTLPSTVDVTYVNNNQMYAGEYEVIAKFSAKSVNEAVDIDELSAYLIINRVRRSVTVYNEATGQYDKEFSAENIRVEGGVATVVGLNTEVFTVTSIFFYSLVNNEPVSPADFVSGNTYKYEVNFAYLDENMNSSVILSVASDNFTYFEA